MKLFLINKNNQVLDLLNSKSRFVLSGAEGLHGIETDIAENETPYTDGATIESVRALPRGIDLVLTLRGNIKESIDYFTSIVKSKQYVTLREVDGARDITIKGIATVPPYSRMLQTCKITLTIYCGQPYWEDLNYLVETISEYVNLLNFPQGGQYFIDNGQPFPYNGRPFGAINTDLTKSFVNKSDTAVGMVITLVALGEVVNPRISCSTGEQNGWYMQLNLTLQTNDEIKISTVKGNKYITINGVDNYNGEPILNYLEWLGNDWLQLETGENTFEVTTDGGNTNSNLHFDFIYKGRYE
jgi:hypothetical protein